jgi:Family of unknown function (DUF6118)
MADEDHDDDGAARAFAELRAEVTILRRAMEDLPAVIKSIEPPDYAPSFGAVGKTLAGVEARLAGIEGHPALKLTAEQHGRAIGRAGAEIVERTLQQFDSVSHDLHNDSMRLEAIVRGMTDHHAQKMEWRQTLAVGVVVGLVLFPMLAAVLPGGSFLAALATGHVDRWQAGIDLMRWGDPVSSQALAAASRLVNANTDALKACEEAAKNAGATQKCTISVPATGQ